MELEIGKLYKIEEDKACYVYNKARKGYDIYWVCDDKHIVMYLGLCNVPNYFRPVYGLQFHIFLFENIILNCLSTSGCERI